MSDFNKIEKNNINVLSPFKLLVLQNFPFIEADFDAITNYQLMCKMTEYMNNINSNVNTLNENENRVYNAFNEIVDYINNYFDNLNVQEEINNKLDKMAEDGSLTNLIKNYVDPIYQTFENNVNNTLNSMQNEINDLTSGAPLVANSTSGMTDTTRIYVNTTDGKWYYYDGDSWKIGGVYQATVQNLDTTLSVNDGIPNSLNIGEKINNNFETKNYFNNETFTNNKYINTLGVLTSDNTWFLSNIIPINNGDTIYCYIWKNTLQGGVSTHNNLTIANVSADGTINSCVASSSSYWTSDFDGFIQVSVKKQSAFNDNDYINGFTIVKNVPELAYSTINYTPIENKEDINEISIYHNYLKNFKLESSYSANNTLVYVQNFFATCLMPCKIGDIFYINYFNNDSTIQFTNVNKLDNNKHFIERSSVGATSYTCAHDGYVLFTCQNINRRTDIGDYCVISKNEILTEYVPPIRYIINSASQNKVMINKIDSNNYLITFGKFKITLFKTDDDSTNAHNWNLKTLTNLTNDVIVPNGTDIIGPIKLQGNSDFIGGVHGDETTNYITVGINGNTYDLSDIISLSGNNLTITMKSTCYNQSTGTATFDRFITIIISENKIHISNNYKALTNTTLISGPIGGLIACRNNIINNIIFNNAYFNTPPTTQQDIANKENTNATINTIYGSLTINNIKGHQLDSYEGYLQTFSNETPIRNKIYFMNYKLGSYSINIGDILSGEFEYILS